MSTEPSEPAAPEPAAAPAPAGPRLISLIPSDGREPSQNLGDAEAEAAWALRSAPWHPALLARLERLPIVEDAASPPPPEADDLLVVAPDASDRLPSGYRTHAEDAGARLLDGECDRHALAGRMLGRLDPEASPGEADDPVVADFLALGTARWMLRDLTVAMGHADCLDLDSLTRETLAGARAWAEGDRAGAVNRLRAAFELLTQARERFYPVDAYLVDLCLLDPSTPAGSLSGALKARAAFTVLSTARGIESLARVDPEAISALRTAVEEGWADVAGGPYDEVEESLLPLESILWQYRKGESVYRAHMDGRNVETLARRRFGLYPMLPQVARRFGLRFALHLGLDSGRFPVPREAKRLWESPDGSTLEAVTRPPVAADREAEGAHLPWRLGKSMKDDHVATVSVVHWPEPVAKWYRDLRRVAAYSPVLARWVTVGDYFHMTDRPWDMLRATLDEYASPYLAQAVARKDRSPIGRLSAHAGYRARLDAAAWLDAVARTLAFTPPRPEPDPASPDEVAREHPTEVEPGPPSHPLSPIEEALETGQTGRAVADLEREEVRLAEELARGVVGSAGGGRPGYLVFNPLCVPRRAAVLLPDAAPGLPAEGPLRVSQFTEDGVWGIVDLPASGFAWVPREGAPDPATQPARTVSVSGRVLRNESVEVEVDEATGGIRGVRAPGEPMARLGQQLVAAGLVGPDGQPATSRMQADLVDVEYGGPALAQVVSRGRLLTSDGSKSLATFHQRVRLWSGRPTVELEVRLSELDPDWLGRLASGDPWSAYLGCRWAWPDPSSALRRSSLLGPVETAAERPETSEAIEISARKHRTALLVGGLAYHRRHGPRMLDTLLVAGGEEERIFRVGVALDLEHPFHAALDLITPAPVVPTESGPPRAGPAGWFFHLDRPSVAVTQVAWVETTGEGRGPGLAFHLLETSGRATRCRLRLFRNPTWARQTDFQGDSIVDLPVEGDAVLVDLTPRELARVEVSLA